MKMNTQRSANDGRPFYRIVPAHNGLVDIWLTPGEAVPLYDNLTGRFDYNFKILAAWKNISGGTITHG